jgi:hypothetical protein
MGYLCAVSDQFCSVPLLNYQELVSVQHTAICFSLGSITPTYLFCYKTSLHVCIASSRWTRGYLNNESFSSMQCLLINPLKESSMIANQQAAVPE